jgi:hypothetical protein
MYIYVQCSGYMTADKVFIGKHPYFLKNHSAHDRQVSSNKFVTQFIIYKVHTILMVNWLILEN